MWTQLLDRVQSPAQLQALSPEEVAGAFVAEIPPATSLAELEARDAYFLAALRAIDDTVTRAMRIELDHRLAHDSSIPTPTRKVFAATVASYAADLSRLAHRARDVAARGGSPDPDAIAAIVVDCARSVLDLGGALQARILSAIRDRASAAVPVADRHARDRDRDDRERKRWSAARRDLEALAADPARTLFAGPLATRLAALPEQLDEPEPEREPTLAELIELD